MASPVAFGLSHKDYKDVELETVDGVKLRCYLLLQRKYVLGGADPSPTETVATDDEFAASRPTVLIFHGNACHASQMAPRANMFYRKMRCNVFMLSYRGFGHSEGCPSEKGLQIDAQTALDYLVSHPILGSSVNSSRPSKIILYGHSLGGAVALSLAAAKQKIITGLILENTFLSVARMIRSITPLLLPIIPLCHQKWDNTRAMAKILPSMSLLMLSGSSDEVVPAAHMVELWKIAKKSQQHPEWAQFPMGTHSDTCDQPGFWDAVSRFVDAEVIGAHGGDEVQAQSRS